MKKHNHIFETSHLVHDLKGKSVRAGVYTLGATVTCHFLQFGSVVILARILLPEHFGLIAMVTVLTALAERFKHLGLSTATIQEKVITHEQVSTLFWINTFVGILIAIAIAGASKGIASFYKEPNLVPVTMALSLGFVFGGLNIQHDALLRRQLRFRALACVQVLANVLSIWLGIELALQEFTYWALVWKEVARSAVEMIGTWIACRWWPGLPAPHSGIGNLLRVGRNVVSIDVVFWLSRSVDQILLGRVAGAHALGLYKQAFQLMAAPMSQLTYPVGSVALPSLSALQDEPIRYERYYTKVLSLLSFVTIPLTTYLIIFSEDVIKIVLGEKWLEATWIFRLLTVGALIEPLLMTCTTVMITQKKTMRLFWWAVMYGGSLVLAFLIGVQWGAIGVAAGYTLAHVILMIPTLWIGFRDTPLSIGPFFQTISMPAFFSIVMATVLVLFAHTTSFLDSPTRIGISVVTAVGSYLALWMIYPRGREYLFDNVSSLLSGLKPTRSVST
jgi:O-antigen/teichoic acid export membrane protein